MLLPFGSPITLATTGITVSGATALTSLAGLKDGRPGAITRLQWPSGPQTTSTLVAIEATWEEPLPAFVKRVAGLVNVRGLPAGLRVLINWQAEQGGSFDEDDQESILFANQAGDLFAWDTTFSFNRHYGFRIEIYNDDGNGNSPVAPETQFDIGEIYAAQARSFKVLPDPVIEPIDGTATQFSRSGQPYDAPQPPRRRWRIRTLRETVDKAMIGNTSTEEIRLSLMANPRVLWSFYEDDLNLARKTLIYGNAKIGSAQSSVGRRWSSEIEIEELR